MLFPRHLFRKNVTLCTGHIYIALEFFMKACTFMFMNVIYLGVRRPFLGQNLPQIRNFHKVSGDIRLVGSRKDLRF